MASQHTIHHTQERVYSSGILSVTSTFKLLVTGDCDIKHLDRLIRILRVQQQILAEDDIEDLMPDIAWYCPPQLAEPRP